jgi:hypothetical protein
MLDFAVGHRKALDLLTQDRVNGLRDFELSEAEWKIVGELRDALKVSWLPVHICFSRCHHIDEHMSASCPLHSFLLIVSPFGLVSSHPPHERLQIFKDATLFFSRGTPNLATVIPAMDHIDQHLTTQSLNRLYGPPVRVALALGKATLNRYYNLTDASEVYRIAMGMESISIYLPRSLDNLLYVVLHPRHKLEYFKNAGWEEDWIKTAEELVRDEFERSYATHSEHDNENDSNNDGDEDIEPV